MKRKRKAFPASRRMRRKLGNPQKNIGDALERRVRDVFNSYDMRVRINPSRQNGQIDLTGINYATGCQIYVECKSKSEKEIPGKKGYRNPVNNDVVAVLVNKLVKRNVIIDHKVRPDCEAYIVTDSWFSNSALEDAQMYGITTIDGQRLAQLEAISKPDEIPQNFLTKLEQRTRYIREHGVREAIGSWLRKRVFDPISP